MSEREFVQFASLRLNWFKPTEAQQLLQISIMHGLVVKRDGLLVPSFDASAVDAPMDFRPSAAILAVVEPEPDVFTESLTRILAATGVDRRTAVAAINAIQERMDVDADVAALIHARRLGIEVADLVDRLQAMTRKRAVL